VKCSPAVGAGLAREHRLVILRVAGVGRSPAGDVGRQRHVAGGSDREVEVRSGEVEGERDLAALPARFDGRVEAAEQAGPVARAGLAEAQPIARRKLLRRPREGEPAGGVEATVQQDFGPGRRLAPEPETIETRGYDPRGVDHQRVAGGKQVGKVGHDAVLELGLSSRTHDQQARGVARRGRTERDQLLGQVEIEQGDVHAA
jgi:hypothetical protein